MRINLLGPTEVVVAGRLVSLAGPKLRAVLAALCVEADRVVPVHQLVRVLWDATPPATARTKVQAYVSALRHAFGPEGPLITRAPGYQLCLDDCELDLAEFTVLSGQAANAVDTGRPGDAADLFSTALGLWRGPALADVDSLVLRTTSAALEDRRMLSFEGKAEADLALGRNETVIAELSALLGAHPLRERLRALIMLALYRHGCRADALAIFRSGRQVMIEELGLEPGPQLRRLHHLILTNDATLEAESARGLLTVSGPTGDRAVANQ